MSSLVDGDWHDVLTGLKAHEELYRWRSDRGESRNLVGSDTALTRIPETRARLYEAIEGDRNPAPLRTLR